MKVTKLGQIRDGQDGAIWGNHLFRLDASGNCTVYTLSPLEEVGRFTLDQVEQMKPHSNSVMFGSEFYSPDDPFPLLYSNIYNNYASAEDKMKGVTCVYRVWLENGAFQSQLVQVIRIGFADSSLWQSENGADVRPYGNFVIDRARSVYYAFTMRDQEHNTRYFAFALPRVRGGQKRVTLNEGDILEHFDCEYHRYVQGACCHDGLIYSLEGFSEGAVNPAGLRIIDMEAKKQREYFPLFDYDLKVEPEMIDFAGETCYYSDSHGAFYQLSF